MNTLKVFTTITFAMILLTGCGSGNPESGAETASTPGEKEIILTTEQFSTAGMELGRITQENFSHRVQATGMIDVPPEYKAAVSVYYGGTVKDIPLLVGQKVQKGSTLFTLENPEYIRMQQDYLGAKSKLNYLKAEYERQKKLLNENVSSRKKYLKAESDYLSVLADYRAMGKQLRLLNINPDKLTPDNITSSAKIKAPISGYVSEVNITKGRYLSPNEAAVAIVSTKHIHLELNIFEKDITRIRKGQPIRFRLPDNKTEYFEGTVFLTGRSVYSADRTINVHGHLNDESHNERFIPGMYVEAEILVDEMPYPALPSDAVVNVDNENYILVKKSYENDRYVFVRRKVRVGRSNDGYTRIVNAEQFENAEILVKGAFNLIQ